MKHRLIIKNHQLEQHYFRIRLAIGGALVVIMFLLLASRFFYVQVAQHEHYQTLAEANRISIVPIVPNRGLILDRNGVLLAHNYSAYTLEITPSKIKNMDTTIDELAKLIKEREKAESQAQRDIHGFTAGFFRQ